MEIEVGVIFSTIIVIFFVYNAYRKARKENDTVDSLVVAFVTALVCAVVISSAFKAGEKWAAGSPLNAIEPGKYEVIGAVKDESFITDPSSRMLLLLTNNTREKARFYSLPTNELQGDPQVGEVLEITEIPSTQRMVFHKR